MKRNAPLLILAALLLLAPVQLSAQLNCSGGCFRNVPDGTAALPSIAWASDPDTGFVKEAANRVAFSAGGSIRMYFLTDSIQAPTGSAGAPSYSFAAVTTKGMWNNGTGLGLSVDGVNRINIATGGGVSMFDLTTASGTPSSICMNAGTEEITVNAALTCTVSSREFKSQINPLKFSGVDVIRAMDSVSFRYNDQPNRTRWGFIAEDLAGQNHALGDGYDMKGDAKSIDQNAILAVAVKAIQELNARIEILEKR